MLRAGLYTRALKTAPDWAQAHARYFPGALGATVLDGFKRPGPAPWYRYLSSAGPSNKRKERV